MRQAAAFTLPLPISLRSDATAFFSRNLTRPLKGDNLSMRDPVVSVSPFADDLAGG